MPVKIIKSGSSASQVNADVLALIKTLPEKYAKAGADLASQLAPVSTPQTNPRSTEPGYVHMRDAITAEPGGGERVGGNSWQVVVGKPYGIFVELGTIYMDAQPFFRPAVASISREMSREFESAIDRVTRGR